MICKNFCESLSKMGYTHYRAEKDKDGRCIVWIRKPGGERRFSSKYACEMADYFLIVLRDHLKFRG